MRDFAMVTITERGLSSTRGTTRWRFAPNQSGPPRSGQGRWCADLAHSLDFVSLNNYPLGIYHKQKYAPSVAALNQDAMRGLKRKNFWVMEQQSGGGGWEQVAVPPKPGEMRLWTYQSIAHGADAIIYFRWRTARVPS